MLTPMEESEKPEAKKPEVKDDKKPSTLSPRYEKEKDKKV
jgi:hypothetical protein